MGTPERADDDVVFVERVVDVARDFGNVDAAKAGYTSLRVGGASAGQKCQNAERLFKFGYEDFRMDPIFEPPVFLALDVSTGRCREPDPARRQRERSSLRISSASTSRSAATSASDSRRAW